MDNDFEIDTAESPLDERDERAAEWFDALLDAEAAAQRARWGRD